MPLQLWILLLKQEENVNISKMSKIFLDCKGLSCPEPLMLLRNTIRNAKAGQIIEVYSEDPVSLRDIPAFCKFMHHELLSLPDENHPHLFVIMKKT